MDFPGFVIARRLPAMHHGPMNKTPTAPPPAAEPPATDQPRLRYVPKPKGSWKRLVGSMEHCDLFPEAMRLGAEWRERMNREGH